MYPQPIPFDKVFMDAVLRRTTQNLSMNINALQAGSLAVKHIFQSPWTALRNTFSEVKINKVTLYIIPGVGLPERGFHLLNVSHVKEYTVSSKSPFNVLASYPGSKMSTISQILKAEWYPTSSDESRWHSVASSASVFDYFYMSTNQSSDGKVAAKYPVEFVFDAKIQLRGISPKSLQSIAIGPAHDDDFEVYSSS